MSGHGQQCDACWAGDLLGVCCKNYTIQSVLVLMIVLIRQPLPISILARKLGVKMQASILSLVFKITKLIFIKAHNSINQ
jgi:hypothetical protein